ncbi:unnamed protein product [Pieris macdunnoughi]|uniref:Transposase n=1 Tax=Pieris macdunnoughi TaxID=345717 RepID=A0A821SP87_9NEOP|nr:unnamed protein product [Pieris macdunnoughi]
MDSLTTQQSILVIQTYYENGRNIKKILFANFALVLTKRRRTFWPKCSFLIHFHLNGYVNKQNCRFWGAENPHEYHEQPLHPEKVTVWCGLWPGGIVGTLFFEDADETAITVNGERYRGMITDFMWPKLDRIDAEDLWFQEDGATAHTSRQTIAREISRLCSLM